MQAMNRVEGGSNRAVGRSQKRHRTSVRILLALVVLGVVTGALSATMPRAPHVSPIVDTVMLGRVLVTSTPAGPVVARPVLDVRARRAFIRLPSGGNSGFSMDGRVAVFDTTTGVLLGTPRVAHANGGSVEQFDNFVLDQRDGRAYVVGYQDTPPLGFQVSVLGTATGRVLRTAPAPQGVLGNGVALDAQSRRLFMLRWGSGDMPISMLDLRTNRLHALMSLIGSPPRGQGFAFAGPPLAVDTRDQRVFVAHLDNRRVSILDAVSGHLRHTVVLGLTPPAAASTVIMNSVTVDERARRAFVYDANSGALTTLDATSGHVVRAVRVARSSTSPLVDAPTGRVFVLASGTLSVVDARTGQLLGVTPNLGAAGTPVVDAPTGSVIASDFGSRSVFICDGTTGRLRRRVTLNGNPTSLAVDEHTGRILVVSAGTTDNTGVFTDASRVSVLDGRSGALLRTVPLGAGYGSIAVDTQAHRAVVIMSGGQVAPGPDAWGWVPTKVRRALPFLPQRAPGPRTQPARVSVLDITRL